MFHHLSSSAENRLAHRTLADFAGATKVTRRSAQILQEKQQVASFNAQKPTSTPGVTASQKDVQDVLAQGYAKQLVDTAAEVQAARAGAGEGADGAALARVSEAQARYETAQKNAENSARIRARYSSLDPDSQNFLKEIETVYAASGAGKPVELDAATGQLKIGKGEIEQGAIERLTKPRAEGGGGLSVSEAVEQINNLKEKASSTLSNTGLGGSFDESGKFVPPPPVEGQTPSASRLNADQLKKDIAALDPEKVKPSEGESTEAFYARLQYIITQRDTKKEELARLGEKNLAAQKAAAGADVTTTPGTETPTAETPIVPGTETTTTTGQETPESVRDGIKTKAEAAKEEALGIVDADPLDTSKQMAAAKAAKEAELSLGNEISLLQDDKAYELQRSKLATNARAEQLASIESAKSELDQMKLNTENEVKARRKIAKLTGNYDMEGLNYVSKSVQDGVDALNYLRNKTANMHGSYADKNIEIINQFGIDLRQSGIDKKSNAMTAYNNYKTALNDIADDIRLDATSRREQKGKVLEKYQETLSKVDFEHANDLQAIRLKSMDLSVQVQKMAQTQRTNEINNAMKMLALSTKKGVNISPDALRSFEKLIAPGIKPGWMNMVKAGEGDGSYSPDEAMAVIQEWVGVDPTNRDITQLTDKDIKLLVSMRRAAGKPVAPGVAGPQPGVPTAFGAPEPDRISGSMVKYRDYVKSLPPGTVPPTYAEFDDADKRYQLERLTKSLERKNAAAAEAPAQDVADPADDILSEDAITEE